MADAVDNVVIRLALQDALSGPMKAVNDTINKMGAALKSLNSVGSGSGVGGSVSRLLFGFGGSFLAIEGLRQALELARTYETNAAKLNIALDGNISRFKQIQAAIEGISKAGVFSQSDLLSAAQQLVERGVPTDRLSETLQVAANTASALRIPLDEAAQQIAQTFGGVLPRSLSRAVPGIRQLSEESLRAGGALDLLANAFGGQDAAFAATAPGKEAAAVRDIAQAWTDVGRALLPIERELLPGVSKGIKALVGGSTSGNFTDSVVSTVKDMENWGRGPEYGNSQFDHQSKDAVSRQQFSDYEALADAAEDAMIRAQKSSKEIDQISSDEISEATKKQAAEQKKLIDEEFKDREISLQDYLGSVESGANRTQDELSKTLGEDTSLFNFSKGRSAKDQQELSTRGVSQEEQFKLEIDIADELATQLALKKEIAETQNRINESERQTLDQRVKAISDATKALPETATSDKKSVENGSLTAGAMNAQLSAAADQIQAALPATFALADKLFSAADAAALKQRLTSAFANAKAQAVETAQSVTPLVDDLIAVGNEARKSAEEGIVKTLTEIETRSKSASEALGDLAKGFITAIANAVNQRLVSSSMNLLFGEGGTGKGSESPPLGGLFGGFAGATGAVLKDLFNGSSGVQGSVPGKEGGNGSGLFMQLAGDVVGGFVHGAGSLFGGSGGGGVGNSGGSGVGNSGGSGSSTATSGDLSNYSDGPGSYGSGGYTGDRDPSRPAGVVHGGELVINASDVSRLGLRNMTSAQVARALAGGSLSRHFSSPAISARGSSTLSSLHDSVNEMASRKQQPVVAAYHVNADDYRQILSGAGVERAHADFLTRNRDVFKPVVSSLK